MWAPGATSFACSTEGESCTTFTTFPMKSSKRVRLAAALAALSCVVVLSWRWRAASATGDEDLPADYA